jgi:hypothetical protein
MKWPATPAAAERAQAVGLGLLLLLLFLLLLAQAPLAVLVIDSGRDLASAMAIVQGESWPRYGPELNATWHLGPIWYYLLALPLAAAQSVAGTALLVSALAASKLWFAYRIGAELGGRSAGIACAALIALPGWSSMGQMVVGHTNVVEAATVATLWLSVRALRRDAAVDVLLAALFAALAIHAHPTASVVLPLLGFATVRVALRRRSGWLPLAAGLVFALPFLPALLAEAAAGWPQLGASQTYTQHSDLLARMRAWPELLWGMSIGQAEWTRDYVLTGTWTGQVWYAAYLFGLLVAALGVLRALARPGDPLRWVLPYTLGSLLLIGLLRDSAPAWMFFALAPMSALLGALGLCALLPPARAPALAGALVLLALVANIAVLERRLFIAESGLAPQTRLTVGDIRRHDPGVAGFWLPAWGHDAIVRRLCPGPPTALHGELATAVHFGQGVAAELGCPQAPMLQLAGRAAERHLLGVPNAVARQLGIDGEATRWGFTLVSAVEVLAPEQTTLPVLHSRYLRNDYAALIAQNRPQRRQVRLSCAAGDLLVIGNLVPLLNPASATVESQGEPLQPELSTFAAEYHRCAAAAELLVTLEAIEIDSLMLVRVPAAPPMD